MSILWVFHWQILFKYLAHVCHITYCVTSRECTGPWRVGDYICYSELVRWPLISGILWLHLLQRGGIWWSTRLPRPLFTVPNVTTHLSRYSGPNIALLYTDSLLWLFKCSLWRVKHRCIVYGITAEIWDGCSSCNCYVNINPCNSVT